MADTNLTCSSCGYIIPLTEALTTQLSGKLEARLHAEYATRLKATAMRNQLDKERRVMNKHWAEREKQIERVIGSTTGM